MMWGSFLAEHAWQLVTMLALLGVSAFFSGSETALFSLSRGDLYSLRRHRTGQIAASLMARPNRTLNALLLSNLLINTAYACISALVVFDLGRSGLSGWVLAVASILPLIVLILLGEVAPKTLAFMVSRQWALLAAAPMALITRVMSPVLAILEMILVRPLTRIVSPSGPMDNAITAEELGAVIDLSAKRGVIGHDTSALIQEIMELTDLTAADIMVPRVDLVAFNVDDPAEGLAGLFRQTHLKKIPVFSESIDNVIGVVYAKSLFLRPDVPLREQVVRVLFVPEAANLEHLLVQFRVARQQLAIVVDEYGGTAGLVTVEDVLEELVGEIRDRDEVAAEPAVQRIDPHEYIVDGELPIHEWADTFGMDLPNPRISTIGGFVTSRLGHIPKVGDVATFRNLRFTVERMRKRRIDRLRLELTGRDGEEDAA